MAAQKHYETELGNYFREKVGGWIQEHKSADIIINNLKNPSFTKELLNSFYKQYSGADLTIPLEDKGEAEAFEKEMVPFRERQAVTLTSASISVSSNTNSQLIVQKAKEDISEGKTGTESAEAFVNLLTTELMTAATLLLIPATIMAASAFYDEKKKGEQERQINTILGNFIKIGGLSQSQANAVKNYLLAVDPIIFGVSNDAELVEAVQTLKKEIEGSNIETGKENFNDTITRLVKYQHNKVDAYYNGELAKLHFKKIEEQKKEKENWKESRTASSTEKLNPEEQRQAYLTQNQKGRKEFEKNIKNEELFSALVEGILRPEPEKKQEEVQEKKKRPNLSQSTRNLFKKGATTAQQSFSNLTGSLRNFEKKLHNEHDHEKQPPKEPTPSAPTTTEPEIVPLEYSPKSQHTGNNISFTSTAIPTHPKTNGFRNFLRRKLSQDETTQKNDDHLPVLNNLSTSSSNSTSPWTNGLPKAPKDLHPSQLSNSTSSPPPLETFTWVKKQPSYSNLNSSSGGLSEFQSTSPLNNLKTTNNDRSSGGFLTNRQTQNNNGQNSGNNPDNTGGLRK